MKTINLIILSILLTIISFQSLAQCIEENHSPFANQGWVSCKTANNPANGNSNSHWLKYDLGSEREILDLRIWNHNVWGETGIGAKTIMVDYSLDKVTWESIGPLDVEEAPGSWKYVAPPEIEFENMQGRYITITVLETWDGNSDCAGIAEIKMNLGNTTSTKEEELAAEFSIYPNPAIDYLQFEIPDNFEPDVINISNSIGQVVMETSPYNQHNQKLAITDLPDGLYNISLQNNQMAISKSFVKMSN